MNMLSRTAILREIKEDEKTLGFTMISKNNDCKRFDWNSGKFYIEKLEVKGAKTDNLKTFFKDHNPSVDNAIGKIENIKIVSGELVCDVVFAKDAESQKVYQKYADGVLSDVSIGYMPLETKKIENEKTLDEVIVSNFEIYELSAVWKGADKGAKKREDEEFDAAQHELRQREYKFKEKKLNIEKELLWQN